MKKKPLGITEVVLRDAHQSLLATRMRIDDMLPIAAKLDQVGYWSLETWGGATFDSCIRFLGEDPWERLRRLKAAMPKTPMQMLFRGQNILGYRHYADDVVEKFVERCAVNGMDVFRIFDAMNDVRNLETAIRAVVKVGKHAQGTLSYTISPVHKTQFWLDMAKKMEDMGTHSICIKDMSGLINPYTAEELVSKLKETVKLPIAMHCHATTGMSTAAIVKAAEAGVDMVDTSISSMCMTYGHSATESVVSIFDGTPRNTGLDIKLLEEIATYFRDVRKKYAKFEGSLKGVDSRILVAQVPGGMLTNMESQLKEQGAIDKFDAVLEEIPRVRKDLGYIPLVTPTSQIVGSQAVFNVLSGERYKSIAKETRGILRGEYGATPAPVNKELQARVLEKGEKPITCRPADLLEPEVDKLTTELKKIAEEKGIKLAKDVIDDVMIYALFTQVGLKFLENRGNPSAFEPAPGTEAAKPKAEAAPAAAAAAPADSGDASDGKRMVYIGDVFAYMYAHMGGGNFVLPPAGQQKSSKAKRSAAPKASAAPVPADGKSMVVPSNLSGTINKVVAEVGKPVKTGDVIIIIEAMKMEAEIHAPKDGTVTAINVKKGDLVNVGAPLLTIA
ncbi:MAG: sodium-extruding oxaloacetate decarboxylase subunit alpha [Magnetococcales bacterium]|nr:sodium-extruding oxaloacetate decarboxylase subunit alpha [Magnetococcales bacterium]MBF0150939.1 sodium-extruding oxaloacetate decarboxylase subunit alpha [Magnetococcales bacterium]MBF0174192.1 sodium-extruding oxaloacetate decarboxylase subunit alpha [Magnetococcales bacterium]MBF0349005.1 sodium-extruding oxaloacetate decarboxylase subunit alpha [Magnetococcales bacterium]